MYKEKRAMGTDTLFSREGHVRGPYVCSKGMIINFRAAFQLRYYNYYANWSDADLSARYILISRLYLKRSVAYGISRERARYAPTNEENHTGSNRSSHQVKSFLKPSLYLRLFIGNRSL